jgi:hypothetical protein
VTFACLATSVERALSLVASGSPNCSARATNKASAQWKAGEELNGQVAQIIYGPHRARVCDSSPEGLTPQYREYLKDEQVRCGKFVLGAHQRLDLLRDADAEQEVDDRGGVEDGHSPWSRIERTAVTLDSTDSTTPRAAIRADNSAGVGRDALRASTVRRYSEKETPEAAARAFSVWCTFSGTSRI